jgi:hypothetical protein
MQIARIVDYKLRRFICLLFPKFIYIFYNFVELSNWRMPARLCWLCAWAFGGRFASVDSLGQSCVGIYLRWLLLIALNYQTGEYLPACVGFVRGLLAAGLRQLTV